MTGEDFVKRIKDVVYSSTVRGILSLFAHPPGRRPSPALVELSQWFNQLSIEDREQVQSALRLAARHAVFGMLVVLDNLRAIREPGEKLGTLVLRYETDDGSVLLNDPHEELLHDIFAQEVPPE